MDDEDWEAEQAFQKKTFAENPGKVWAFGYYDPTEMANEHASERAIRGCNEHDIEKTLTTPQECGTVLP